MGQQDVFNLLKRHKNKWLSAREIAEFLNTSFNTVIVNLKRLRKAGTVMCKTVIRVVEPAGRKPLYLYKYKK